MTRVSVAMLVSHMHSPRLHAGFRSHRFLPRAGLGAVVALLACRQPDTGSVVVVEDAGRKSVEGPQANSRTPEAQWLAEGGCQIPAVMALGNGDALPCARMLLPLWLHR